MTETLQEFVSSRGVAMRVDRAETALRGVKILGLQSRNGRTYQPEALAEAARLYEGAKVNVNHTKGDPSRPRDYQDRIGAIHNVALRPGEGLFGDFQLQPKTRSGRATLLGRRARPGKRRLLAQRRGPRPPFRRERRRRGDPPRPKRGPGGRPGHDPRAL